MASRYKSHKKRVYAFGRNRIAHLETSYTKSKPNRQHAYCQRAARTSESYGLRGYSTLRKHGLIRLIAEARAPVFRERLERALKTGRYSALRKDFDNTHKKHNAFGNCICLRMRSQQPCWRKNTSKKSRRTPENGSRYYKGKQSVLCDMAYARSHFHVR